MRILALDVGTKRIGLAVSDELGITAQSKPVLVCSSWTADIKALQEQIDAFQIGEIVVGYPVNLNGSVGPQAEWVLKFVEKMKEHISLPIKMWDERLSSMAVDKLMLEGDLSRQKRKKRIDSLSAQWILQGYLESKRNRPPLGEIDDKD